MNAWTAAKGQAGMWNKKEETEGRLRIFMETSLISSTSPSSIILVSKLETLIISNLGKFCFTYEIISGGWLNIVLAKTIDNLKNY